MKSLEPVERDGMKLQIAEFESQPNVPLKVYLLKSAQVAKPERLILSVLDADGWTNWLGTVRETFGSELTEECRSTPAIPNAAERLAKLKHLLERNRSVIACLAPRGIGLTAWSGKTRDQVQIRRRFMLLGQTLDEMRVWDILVALNTIPDLQPVRDLPITLQSEGSMAVNALYASLFAKPVHELRVSDLPHSHRLGPDYLNVLRVLDIPQTVAMAAERGAVTVFARNPGDWTYPRSVQMQLGWPKDRPQILIAEQ